MRATAMLAALPLLLASPSVITPAPVLLATFAPTQSISAPTRVPSATNTPSLFPTSFAPTTLAPTNSSQPNTTDAELEQCDPSRTDSGDSSLWLVGVFIAVLASVGSNVGLNLQKLTHVRIERQVKAEIEMDIRNGARPGSVDLESSVQSGLTLNGSPSLSPSGRANTLDEVIEQRKKLVNYTKSWVWRLGLVMVMLSSFIDFAALAFAPQTVIAPLGSVTLVANMVLAPLMFGEKNTRRDSAAVMVIIIGCVISVVYASHCDATFTPDQLFVLYGKSRFVVYAIVCIAAIVALRILIRRYERSRRDQPAAYEAEHYRYHRFAVAAAAGIMGAQSLLFAKCTVELLKTTLIGKGVMFVHWQTYIVLTGLGVTIFGQIRWLNQGLQDFDALYIVPVFQSFWLLTSVVAGMIFFGEYVHVFSQPTQAVAFPFGIILTIVGVMVLSQRVKHLAKAEHKATDEPSSPDAHAPDDIMKRGLLDPEPPEAEESL